MASSGKLFQRTAKALEILTKTKNFDGFIGKTLSLHSCEPGKCVMLYKVDGDHLNKHGTLHGGMSASLVDLVSTLTLMKEEGDASFGFSVDLNLSYLNSAKAGDEILIEAEAIKVGKRLAFLECQLRNKDTNQILVKGSHTKYVGN